MRPLRRSDPAASRRPTVAFASLALLFAAAGCATAPQAAPRCELRLEATPLRGGDDARDRGFPGGVSLVDVDLDGDLDLFTTGGYAPVRPPYVFRRNTLYLNDGTGTFRHSGDPVLEAAEHPYSGSSWADVDGDGDPDAFIGTQHRRPDLFLRNLGGGRFAAEALGDATTERASNFATAWADMDGDGDYDLMSGGPTLELAGPLLVFRNDAGRFTRVTDSPVLNGRSNAGAILWADFDNDGDPDFLAANSDIMRVNDLEPAEHEGSQLYRNDGAWRFVRTEDQPFSARAFSATSAAVGDVDGDGDLDIYIGHSGYGHPEDGRDALFLNDGTGRFVKDDRFTGHLHGKETTSVNLSDLDLDGDLDLVTTVYDEGVRVWVNDGSGVFAPAPGAPLIDRVAHHWGSASGDIDGDGDPDLVVGNWGETEAGDFATLAVNRSEGCGRSVHVRLRARTGALDPIGARVTLVTRGPDGERRQLRESTSQSTFRSQSADPFLFGVPDGHRVVRAEVRWPDGARRVVTRFERGRRVRARIDQD